MVGKRWYLVAVVLQVVLLEGDAVRYAKRQVPDQSEEAVGQRSSVTKRQVVTDLVYGQRQRVVHHAAETVT